MTFKVGDRVRVIRTSGFFDSRMGLHGTIVKLADDGRAAYVTFDDTTVRPDFGFSEDLQLASEDCTERIRACLAKRGV